MQGTSFLLCPIYWGQFHCNSFVFLSSQNYELANNLLGSNPNFSFSNEEQFTTVYLVLNPQSPVYNINNTTIKNEVLYELVSEKIQNHNFTSYIQSYLFEYEGERNLQYQLYVNDTNSKNENGTYNFFKLSNGKSIDLNGLTNDSYISNNSLDENAAASILPFTRLSKEEGDMFDRKEYQLFNFQSFSGEKFENSNQIFSVFYVEKNQVDNFSKALYEEVSNRLNCTVDTEFQRIGQICGDISIGVDRLSNITELLKLGNLVDVFRYPNSFMIIILLTTFILMFNQVISRNKEIIIRFNIGQSIMRIAQEVFFKNILQAVLSFLLVLFGLTFMIINMRTPLGLMFFNLMIKISLYYFLFQVSAILIFMLYFVRKYRSKGHKNLVNVQFNLFLAYTFKILVIVVTIFPIAGRLEEVNSVSKGNDNLNKYSLHQNESLVSLNLHNQQNLDSLGQNNAHSVYSIINELQIEYINIENYDADDTNSYIEANITFLDRFSLRDAEGNLLNYDSLQSDTLIGTLKQLETINDVSLNEIEHTVITNSLSYIDPISLQFIDNPLILLRINNLVPLNYLSSYGIILDNQVLKEFSSKVKPYASITDIIQINEMKDYYMRQENKLKSVTVIEFIIFTIATVIFINTAIHSLFFTEKKSV